LPILKTSAERQHALDIDVNSSSQSIQFNIQKYSFTVICKVERLRGAASWSVCPRLQRGEDCALLHAAGCHDNAPGLLDV
jgi:hypothetical protein